MTISGCKCLNENKAGCPVHENEYLDELIGYARSLGKPVFVFNSEGLIKEDVCEVRKHEYSPQFTPDIVGRCMFCGIKKEEHPKVGDEK